MPVEGERNAKKYRIAIISDRDKNSKLKGENYKWVSKLLKGWVTVTRNRGKLSVGNVEWDANDLKLESDLNQKGRAMEMSELVVFNGKLYTCDDKTGMVYELVEGSSKPVPFVRLNGGDGKTQKAFKCEWMTVKDSLLYIGSHALEWVNSDGTVASTDMFWVKTVSARGEVKHLNWLDEYNAIRAFGGYSFPGYLTMEAVNWSHKHRKWFFLPRKASEELWESTKDETKGTNKLFSTDRNFCQISQVDVGALNKTRGFSSFKFIPDSHDQVLLALKTVEVGDVVETYIGGYTLKGETLMEPVKIADDKFEGLEFV